MRTIYAIQLQITPAEGQGATSAFADLCGRVRAWVTGKYKRSWATTINLTDDGQTLLPLEGHSVRGHLQSTDTSDLFILDWTHPADDDPSTAWVTTCLLARHKDIVQFAILIRISTTRVILRPVRFDLGRPRLVTELLNSFETSIDGWSVPAGVETLASPEIEDYVTKVLLNANRNLPVVMISPDAWNAKYSVDAQRVFDRVRGFAHVAVLSDKWAAFKLTDVLEKPLACFDGAVRVYWPSFALNDNPFQHRLFMAQSIRNHDDNGLPLDVHLFRTFAAVASFRYTEGLTIRDARKAIVDLDRKKVDELRELVRTGSIHKESLEMQLLEALEKIDNLNSECEQLKSDLSAQQSAWAEVQQAMAVASQDTVDAQGDQTTRFESVSAALQQAAKDFAGPLLFLESAYESAKESPYKEPDRVYELFEALHLVAHDWRENAGSLGRSWNEAIRALGFDLRDQVSQTSKNKYADEYNFLYKGEKQLFEKHITIGAKQADKCLSVHWYRDDGDLVLVIGHCGRHLTNTKS